MENQLFKQIADDCIQVEVSNENPSQNYRSNQNPIENLFENSLTVIELKPSGKVIENFSSFQRRKWIGDLLTILSTLLCVPLLSFAPGEKRFELSTQSISKMHIQLDDRQRPCALPPPTFSTLTM